MRRSSRFDEVDADELLGEEDDVPAGPPRRARHRAPSPVGRVVRGLTAVVAVLMLAVAGGAWLLVDRYEGNVDRVPDVFADLPADERPAPASPAADTARTPVTFLLVGSSGESGEDRADAIMLARLAGDRRHLQVVSIPRSALVDAPEVGEARLDTTYAEGGPALLVRTVEALTGVRIGHFASVDFAGLVAMTDHLGGVDVAVAETTTEGAHTFTAGANHLDGAMARAYIGPSVPLPGGDLDRVARQQNYLRSMFDTLSDTGLLELALSAHGLEPAGIAFITAPVVPAEPGAGTVRLDATAGARLWGFLQTDSLAQHVDEFIAG